MSLITTLGMKDGDISVSAGTVVAKDADGNIITDGNGNPVFVKGTVISVDTDINALADQIDCALSTIKGEMDDSSEGVDYYNIVLANVPMSMKIRELSRVIYSVPGVRNVVYLASEKNNLTGALSFRFSIESIFGTMEYTKIIENM